MLTSKKMTRGFIVFGALPIFSKFKNPVYLFNVNVIAIANKKDATRTYANRMDIIRFISMCSIVWGHCLLGWDIDLFKTAPLQVIQILFIQIGRLGTINFFLISGFFLGDKLEQYTVLTFLRHKLFTLILPWIIFLALFVIIELFHVVSVQQIADMNLFSLIKLCLILGNSFIFHSAYWFIPTSVMSCVVLIILKKYVDKLWFGVLLAAIVFFYSINLYFGWIPVDHTKAIMGYTFFIWLGIQLKRKTTEIKSMIDNLSRGFLLTIVAVVFVIACVESKILTSIGSVDPFASIRLSNIILSILIFACLLRSNNFNWVKYLNPRKYILGVYLIHCIIISQLSPFGYKWTTTGYLHNDPVRSVVIQLCFFILALSLSYIVVTVIDRSRLRFVIGLKHKNTASYIMKPIFIPDYITQYLKINREDVSALDAIKATYNKNLATGAPLISVVMPAYNEEENIVPTLASLCSNITSNPVEIIVVNNNSKDRTEELVKACGVNCVDETKQGITNARNKGLSQAKGKYILNADADTIYPKDWIEEMTKPLIKDEGAAITYGIFSFIPIGSTGRVTYYFYEMFAELSRFYNNFKKTEAVNVYGFNSGFRREQGLQVDGFNHPPGTNEDGYLALKLTNKGFGKMYRVSVSNAIVWTTDRRIQIDGGLWKAIGKRLTRLFNLKK